VGRLSGEDVERIATKTRRKFVDAFLKIALLAVFAVWLLPILLFGALSAVANATAGLPQIVGVTLTASVIAIPLVFLVLAWSRTRTR
jgi:hypothetical protein